MPTTIAALIRCNKNLNKYKLTSQEESDLQTITQFLKPFYETTNNSTSLKFLKTATTQMSDKIQKYSNEIYDKTAFMAAILDPRIKLKLMPDDMNTEANTKDYLAIQSTSVLSEQVFSKAGNTIQAKHTRLSEK
ncbi:10521_t:CDS:2, partial [Cetraspora pellucida]